MKIHGVTGSRTDGVLSEAQQKALDRRQYQCAKSVQDYWAGAEGHDLYPEIAMPTGFGKGRVVHRLLKSSMHDQILTIVGSKNILLDQSRDVLEGLAKEDTGEADFSILPDLSGRVVLSTWQGLHSFSRKHTKRPDFGLAVIDEVHNIGTPSRIELLKWLKPEHAVGLTATAVRASGKFRVPEQYGFTVVDSMPLPECIDKRWLSPLMGISIDTQVMLPAAVRENGNLNHRKMNQAFRKYPELFGNIAKDVAKRFLPSGMKTVIVVNRVEEEACVIAKELMKKGFKVGLAVNQNAARKLSGQFITLDAISRFKLPHGHPDSIQVLISPQVIGEGFDAPATECVIWAAPTMSHVRYTQVIGRGSRRCLQKKYCLIVDYVYLIENYGYSYNFAQFFKKEDLQELEDGFMYVGPEDVGRAIELPGDFTRGGKMVSVIDLRHITTREYSREELIQQLQALAKELGKTPTQIDVGHACHQGKCASPPTFAKMFGGSFSLALEAAGLSANYKLYTREIVVKQLKQFAAQIGRTPITQDIKKGSGQGQCPSTATLSNHFGSIPAALEAAGLKSKRQAQCEYTQADLISQLKKMKKKLRRTPISRDINEARERKECASIKAFVQVFGSFNESLKAAGFQTCRVPTASDTEVLERLKELAKKLGRSPKAEEVDEASKRKKCPSKATFMRRFGSFENALLQAGLIDKLSPSYSDGMAIEQLQALGKKLGRVPVTSDVNEASKRKECPNSSTLITHFGSFNKALIAAGFTPSNERRKYTNKELLQQLRDLASELGYTPRVYDVINGFTKGKCANVATFAKKFGTFLKAVKKAGLPPGRLGRVSRINVLS